SKKGFSKSFNWRGESSNTLKIAVGRTTTASVSSLISELAWIPAYTSRKRRNVSSAKHHSVRRIVTTNGLSKGSLVLIVFAQPHSSRQKRWPCVTRHCGN